MTRPERSRRVLLVGAHLDGQWVDVPTTVDLYRVHQPLELEPLPASVSIPVPEFVDYRLERMPFAIRTARTDMWVGVAAELRGPERDQAIVRALFQRDVAQTFQGAW